MGTCWSWTAFATVLRDALNEHCEDYGAHYANLIAEMRKKLRASWETLDYMGVNAPAMRDALEGVDHG